MKRAIAILLAVCIAAFCGFAFTIHWAMSNVEICWNPYGIFLYLCGHEWVHLIDSGISEVVQE